MSPKRYKPRIPRNAAPVAKSVALRCLAIRRKRNLTPEEAAKQLGIKPGHYVWIEQGRIIPGPRLAKRLYEWAMQGATFEAIPFHGEAHYDASTNKPWPVKRVRFPPDEYLQLKRAAYKTGMTPEAFICFAVRLLVQNGKALLTVSNAVRDVQWAQSVQALQDENLRYFLEAESEMVVDRGEDAPAPESRKAVIERFIEEVSLEGEDEVEEL